jgi:hypothetical protein
VDPEVEEVPEEEEAEEVPEEVPLSELLNSKLHIHESWLKACL